MADATIISGCFGRYDTVKPIVPQTIDVEWLMVTDEPDLVAPGWRVIVEKRPHVHPNIAAKLPKFFPNIYAPHARKTIWADASSLIQPHFAAAILKKLESAKDGWVMFPHPNRSKITEEVTASRGLPKYDDMDLEGQVAQYIGEGFPNNQLWATGIIGRSGTSIDRDFANAWLWECVRWSFQDQLSFPYLCWKFDLHPTPITGSLWSNDLVWFDNHGRA